MSKRIRNSAGVLLSLAFIGASSIAGAQDASVIRGIHDAAAIRASDFIDSIGVNVHLQFVPGKYADAARIIADLKYLGLNHMRDVALNPSKPGYESYGRLAEAGIKLCLFAPGWDPLSDAVTHLRDFAVKHSGAISAIEGPNEVHVYPLTHEGRTGLPAAMKFQNDLYAAVKAEPTFEGIPVYHMTAPPGVVGQADFANMHPYPKKGDQPLATLTHEIGKFLPHMPGRQAVMTETGYYTLPGGPGWEGVDEVTQAKLTLNLIFDAIRLGVERVYLYALLDAYPDPEGRKINQHFGLFGYDDEPKPVAVAIHNLTTFLQDTGEKAGTFTPDRLEYSMDGLSPAGGSLLLQKSSGDFALVVWDEPDIWDEDSDRPATAAARQVTINLGAKFREVRIYDPLFGAVLAAGFRDVAEIRVDVSDRPLIIEARSIDD